MHLRLLVPFLLLAFAPLGAQWVNHYPKVEGYRHHI